MSPENIAQLSRSFLPQIAAMGFGQNAGNINALRTSQANRGLYNSPIGLTTEAGYRANTANNWLAQAFQQGAGLAQNRASAYSSQPFQSVQPNYWMGNALGSVVNTGISAAALAQQPKMTYAPNPYSVGGSSNSGYQWKDPNSGNTNYGY